MSTLKLLVIEDSVPIQKIINHALPDSVFEKRFAADGAKGLELYKAWQPDIILLDVMLPVMTGFSVLKAIRKDIGDRSTTIIMQTSITEKSNIIQFVRLGIQGYVVKPFDPREVGKKILNYFGAMEPDRAGIALEELEHAVAMRAVEVSSVVEYEGEAEESDPVAEADYLEEFKVCLQDGLVSEDGREILERHRKNLGISKKKAAELEKDFSSSREQSVNHEEAEYLEEVKFCLEKGSITESERRILNRLRDKLEISADRAAELEKSLA